VYTQFTNVVAGRIIKPSGPHAARGPRVGYPCSKIYWLRAWIYKSHYCVRNHDYIFSSSLRNRIRICEFQHKIFIESVIVYRHRYILLRWRHFVPESPHVETWTSVHQWYSYDSSPWPYDGAYSSAGDS
jgi:hypothetical protein